MLGEIRELQCKSAKEVEEARVRLLGRKGVITALFEEFRTVAPEVKRELGRPLNELKQAAQARIEELKAGLGAGDLFFFFFASLSCKDIIWHRVTSHVMSMSYDTALQTQINKSSKQ